MDLMELILIDPYAIAPAHAFQCTRVWVELKVKKLSGKDSTKKGCVRVCFGKEIFFFNEMNMSRLLKCRIGPSVLNSDLSQLLAESQRLLDNGADYLHLDVMDGHFVPNLTFGHPVVKCLRSKLKNTFLETHMMVSNPEQWIEPMADAGVNLYTFHIEPVAKDVLKVCRKIREAGMKVGLALKPGTGIEAVRQFIDSADMILIMTVEPGFGGQKFMNEMMPKVQWLRKNYPLLDIEVDGGVGLNTINACAEAGANMIVSGTAVTSAVDQKSVIANLRETVERSIHKCNV